MLNKVKNSKIKKNKFSIDSILKINELGIFIGFVLLFIIFLSINDSFLTVKNLLNVLRQSSILGVIAMGTTMIIVSGEFDISVGSVYGLAVMLSALLMNIGLPVWLSIIITLLSAIIIGIINGVLVTYGRIPSFIVTLGMLSTIRGFALVLTGGYFISITPIKDPLLDFLYFMTRERLFGVIPNMGIIFIIIAIISYIVFHRTIIGFRMRAVGGNPVAAEVSGINVKWVKILAFSISSFTAALGGLLSLFFLSNAQGTAGQGVEFQVIGATIIGGTSIMGGTGSILGTIIGVLIVGVLRNGLVLAGVSPHMQTMVIGLVIIGAVFISMWIKNKKTMRL